MSHQPAESRARITLSQLHTWHHAGRKLVMVTAYDAVTARIADAAGVASNSAAVIHSIVAGGPADRAGLKEGDVLLSLDGHPVSGPGPLLRMLDKDQIGRRQPASILRSGRILELQLVPLQRPSV